jgi:carotenoid cleavage dioxygenase-like enzyme
MAEATERSSAFVSGDRVPHATGARFPKAIQSVSREEFYGSKALTLTIKNGQNEPAQLPPDLQGHLFIIAPVGSVDSPPADPLRDPNVICPAADGWTPVLSGDGMVYRLDFHKTLLDDELVVEERCTVKEQPGQAWLVNRIVKTPSYYVDAALHNDIAKKPDQAGTRSKYPTLSKSDQFLTVGLARLSFGFGTHNQNNTALIPLKFEGQGERLVVTEDIGRPWEIDPCTLKLTAPVGLNADWQPVVQANTLWGQAAFPPIMTSAHPVFDASTGQFFTVNIVKSPSTLLSFTRWLAYKLHDWKTPWRSLIARGIKWLQELIDGLFKRLNLGDDCLYLVLWDGKSDRIQTWQVTQPDGRPVRIEQTLHQMALTDKYIVLADTSLKISPDDLIPKLNYVRDVEVFWRKLTSYPQAHRTQLYIVARDDLDISTSLGDGKRKSVKAQRMALPQALVHFVVDYSNPDGKLILHTGHINAWDTSEFVHGVDQLAHTSKAAPTSLDPSASVQPVVGMVSAPTDVNRVTSYVLAPNAKSTEQVQRTDLSYEGLSVNQYPWGIAFYAYRDDANHILPPQHTDLYWNSWGLWYELFTDFVYRMYEHYDHREFGIDRVVAHARGEGIPAQLCHVQIKQVQEPGMPLKLMLTIPDGGRYQFPRGIFGTSAQFVPRHNTDPENGGRSQGYVVCVVTHSNELFSRPTDDSFQSGWSQKTEFWIFDASNLAQGPQYKLSHPNLNIGFTAHTCWLSDLQPPPARHYNIRADFADWMNRINPNHPSPTPKIPKGFGDPNQRFQEIEALFNAEVYPHFE